MLLSSPFAEQLCPTAIRAITTRIREDAQRGNKIISFAGGMPCSDFFPTEALLHIFQRTLQEEGAEALQYAATEGYRPLQAQIALLVKKVGIQTTNSNILVTAGSQQALNYICRAMLGSDDTVLCENPTYVGALDIFRSYTSHIIGIPMEDDGMDLNALEALLQSGLHPRFLYTIPDFQNPTGRSMSLEKRHKLLELAQRYSLLIVEDAPYSLLSLDGAPLPAIKSLDAAEHVIYLGSFSKIICPGMRVGYILADSESIEKLIYLKQRDDLQTDNLSQRLVCGFLRESDFDAHLQRISMAYRARRDAMLEAIDKTFPSGTRCLRAGGGMFLWVELPQNYDASAIFDSIYQRGFAYVPGAFFHVSSEGRHTMRLNFCSFAPENAARNTQAFGQTLSDVLATHA